MGQDDTGAERRSTINNRSTAERAPPDRSPSSAVASAYPIAGDVAPDLAELTNSRSRSDPDSRDDVAPQTPFPPAVRMTTTSSSRPYSSFSTHTRWMIVILAGVAGVLSPISSNIFVPAIPTLAEQFNRGEEQISLAVTVYLVFQAITPSFFGSMSDSFGRRPVYVLTLTLYLGANIGLALCPTSAFWLLLVLRALQATGGSAVIAIGSGTITDVAEPRERGKFMALFQGTSMVGPAFGPLLGGVFAETLGWRSIFWFLAITTGVVLVPLIFVMPETLRSIVGDGSIPPPPLNMSPPMFWRYRMAKRHPHEDEEEEPVERPPHKPYKPLSAFMILLTTPEVTLAFVFTSLLYTEYYCILTVFSTIIKDKYNLSELQIGLCYLPTGFGSILGSYLNGLQVDYYYRREDKRLGGDYRHMGETFKIEWTRLRCLLPYAIVFLVGSTALGWTLQAQAPLAAVLVVGFFMGLGTGTNNTATIYGQDLLPGQGGAVSASLNLVRCLFGAVGTSVIQLMYSSPLGAGWTFVLLSGICVLAAPVTLWPVLKHGRAWREKRDIKRRNKT